MDGLNIVNALSRSECPCNSNSCHHGSDVSNSSVDLSKLAEAGIQVKAEENLEPSVTDKSVFLPDHSSVGPQPSSMERVLMDFPDMTAFLQELPEKVFFRRYMGLKGALSTPENVSRTREMADRLTEIKAMAVAGKWFSPRAVFAFFPAFSVDNELHIPEAEDRKGGLFRFPVLKQRSGFCLARLVGARTKTPLDTIALFAATGGSSHLALAAEFEKQGDYFAAHALLALGVECAEMAAVAAHREIRRIWNIADGIGERFSFGYPACPELSDQKTLFDLINAGELGINLTENYMMVPENSVSGIVFAHAEARLNSGD
jgi:5-methyltetrahydrofolate--homocysteine methyltransferase